MKIIKQLTITLLLAVFAISCTSSTEKAQKRSFEAQEDVAKERLKMVEEYNKCIEESGNDKNKIDACDSFLKAAEALR